MWVRSFIEKDATQTAGQVSSSQVVKLSLMLSRPRVPFGWRKIGHDVTMWSAVCSAAPHSQVAVRAIPHLCIVERKRPIPVRRRFSRTQAGLGSRIPEGGALTSAINVCSREESSRHSVLHLWSAQCAALMLGSSRSLSSSSAAGTNGCLDFSCRCPP